MVPGTALHASLGPPRRIAGISWCMLLHPQGVVCTSSCTTSCFTHTLLLLLLQSPEADYDNDPATSEGLFVFTSSAPPATVTVGALVQVNGTVVGAQTSCWARVETINPVDAVGTCLL